MLACLKEERAFQSFDQEQENVTFFNHTARGREFGVSWGAGHKRERDDSCFIFLNRENITNKMG